jgi:hypothetical protein
MLQDYENDLKPVRMIMVAWDWNDLRELYLLSK